MNKLTAEVARRNIHLLKEMQSATNIGLSMRSELFLQALEIALPVLEQQDRWIKCSDHMPTDGKAVIVCSRQGTVQDMSYFWSYGKWWPVSEDDDPAHEGEFSHWQPLPSPPLQESPTDTYRQIENDGREG